MSVLRSAAIAYGATAAALVLYNVRWRYLFSSSKARDLPLVKVEADAGAKQTKKKSDVVVVLLHGMWHDSSFYAPLQQLLAKHGHSSFAISLLPGERVLPGGSQRELVRDLEHTVIKNLGVDQRFVLLGHSQGGLVAQSALQNSKVVRENTVGAILLGTYPLGLRPSLGLLKTSSGFYKDWGYGYICAFGKLLSARYTKKIFLMPTTDETEPGMAQYIQKLLRAPSDGLVTVSHHMLALPPMPIQTPVMVLGASHDIIYPPLLLKDAFDERFPNATHVIAPNQAHCFVDPEWETVMAQPLLEWIDKIIV